MTIAFKYIIFTVMSISDFFRKLFGKSRTAVPEIQESAEPPRPEERYILCIDGGGMRGIVPVVILQKLESLIREKGGEDDIASYFDLIAGTSTGGLISLALTCDSSIGHTEKNGSMQIDLESLLKNYMSLGKEIFQARSLFGIRQFVSDKYSSTNIQNMTRRWFGASLMDRAKVPTLIMSYDLSSGSPEMIRSYGDGEVYPVWVAARATSAAPTYFSPCEYGGKLLADGGVVANNPSLYAYAEARRLFPECQKFHILSISTGGEFHTMEKEDTRGLMNWADQVTPMFDTAQKRTTDYLLHVLPDVDYLRIDDALPEHVNMDETEPAVLRKMEAQARRSAENRSEVLEAFAASLVENMEYRKNASETGDTGREDGTAVSGS